MPIDPTKNIGYVGIDLGFGETGVMYLDRARRPLSWSTMSCSDPEPPSVLRAVSLAEAIVDRVLRYSQDYLPETLVVSIELPIYNHNTEVLILQTRLLEEVEAGLFWGLADTVNLFVVEVNPITSKFVYTGYGRSTKAQMLEAAQKQWSHGFPAVNDWIGLRESGGIGAHTLETLIDTHAHALTGARCYEKNGQEFGRLINMSALKVMGVKDVHRGQSNQA